MTDGQAHHTLEQLKPGVHAKGIDPAGPVTVTAVEWYGNQAINLTYRPEVIGTVTERLLYRSDEGTFTVIEGAERSWSFDGDAAIFRLAAEARRINLAHLFDPYLALSSSQVTPYPHQIEAVYGELLPRQPCRFLLADDPGAGKTIMAGLYIKELILRGDAERILIVAPGSLALQWQDELREKFELEFDVVTKADLDDPTLAVFKNRSQLIVRVDQVARRDEVVERLPQFDWDLVIVDEAHRMSAQHFPSEIKETKKYKLGRVLGAHTRHFLLMTATPHTGKEENFQLFLALLDSDQFEGRFRDGVHSVDASRVMRRMVKEKLVTFEGTPLFPERIAKTIDYELSEEEVRLYEAVTAYVKEQMNAADRLIAEGQGRRGNTVGFALTLLQRRLASSPEAIYASLVRRRKRLQARLLEERQRARAEALGIRPDENRLSLILAPDGEFNPDEFDELSEDDQDELEAEVIDAATAAATVAELEAEIRSLELLEKAGKSLRDSRVDRKWSELSELLSSAEVRDGEGRHRKLIIFTEHKDTLHYLVDRLRVFFGTPDAVTLISGSTSREERKIAQQRFTQDKDCLILVATDAASEGVNLQVANLTVNYDLPWNPNRIEQRFGRVHRIGQEHTCFLWNLVATDTAEHKVYARLLEKIEAQRKAYDGEHFDVLGEAISGTELRSLLIDAIRYDDQPEVRARLDRVIEEDVPERVRKAIQTPPLLAQNLEFSDLERIRREMNDAVARRLQPHYISSFFIEAFRHLGGRLVEREPERYEVTHIPRSIIDRDRQLGTGVALPDRFHRICFERSLTNVKGSPIASLVCPGHPLLDATVDLILERHRSVFRQGTVFVDENEPDSPPRAMVMLEHAIVDATTNRSGQPTTISQRFEFVELHQDGSSHGGGYAPYLDYVPPTGDDLTSAATFLEDHAWLTEDLEASATEHAITTSVPAHLARIRLRIETLVDATKDAVRKRLTKEINYWHHRASELEPRVAAGRTPQVNVDNAIRRGNDLAARLKDRLTLLDQQRTLRPLPPQLVGGAVVIGANHLRQSDETDHPVDELSKKEVEERAVAAVLEAEEKRGWFAEDLNIEHPNHPGYDVYSETAAAPNETPRQHVLIEVKGRIVGSTTVTVSKQELLTSKNDPDHWVLALVEVDPANGETVRYVTKPFPDTRLGFAAANASFNWKPLWEAGVDPSKYESK